MTEQITVFISDDQVTCFSCKMTGYVASKCPFSIESQTNNIGDSNEPTDLINDSWIDKK
jgi:hypothetical protein